MYFNIYAFVKNRTTECARVRVHRTETHSPRTQTPIWWQRSCYRRKRPFPSTPPWPAARCSVCKTRPDSACPLWRSTRPPSRFLWKQTTRLFAARRRDYISAITIVVVIVVITLVFDRKTRVDAFKKIRRDLPTGWNRDTEWSIHIARP